MGSRRAGVPADVAELSAEDAARLRAERRLGYARHRAAEGRRAAGRAHRRRATSGEEAVVDGVDGHLAGRSRAAGRARAVRAAHRAAVALRPARVRPRARARTSSGSSTSSRCTSRRRSAAGATSRCRSCTAIARRKAGCRSRPQGRGVPGGGDPRGRAVHGRDDGWRPRRDPGARRLARTRGHRHPRDPDRSRAGTFTPRRRQAPVRPRRARPARRRPPRAAGLGQDVREVVGGVAPPRHRDRLEPLPARGGAQLVGDAGRGIRRPPVLPPRRLHEQRRATPGRP